MSNTASANPGRERPAHLLRFEEVSDFREALSPETDRGCALLAASYLDSQIEELLKRRLVDDEKVIDELFGPSKPLGTFSSRIDLAYALGLFGKQTRRDLHLLRKIRNSFGHSPKPISFDDTQIADWCSELYHNPPDQADAPRHRFVRAIMGILGIIHAQGTLVGHANIASDVDIAGGVGQRWAKFQTEFETLFEQEQALLEQGKTKPEDFRARMRDSLLNQMVNEHSELLKQQQSKKTAKATARKNKGGAKSG